MLMYQNDSQQLCTNPCNEINMWSPRKKPDLITKSSRSHYETLAKLTEFVKDVARSIRGPRIESRILELKAHVRTLKF